MIEGLGRGDHLPEGPEPATYPCEDSSHAINIVGRIINRLKKQGLCNPEEVLILHKQSDIARSPLGDKRALCGRYVRELTGADIPPDSIRRTSSNKAKGLDARAVILIGLPAITESTHDFTAYTWFMAGPGLIAWFTAVVAAVAMVKMLEVAWYPFKPSREAFSQIQGEMDLWPTKETNLEMWRSGLDAVGVPLPTWRISHKTEINKNWVAPDRDIDAAFSLLMADRKYGSTGEINDRQSGVDIINSLMKWSINQPSFTISRGEFESGYTMAALTPLTFTVKDYSFSKRGYNDGYDSNRVPWRVGLDDVPPIAVSTMVDPINQEWLNTLYARMRVQVPGETIEGAQPSYFGDAVMVCCLLVLTRNRPELDSLSAAPSNR